MALPTDPERKPGRTWRGVGSIVQIFICGVLLFEFVPIITGVWSAKHPANVPPPAASPVVHPVVSPSPAANVAASAPPPHSSPAPVPTPRVLPVSNAFTTLEDYRQRRAAAPHPPEPLTPPPAGRTPETELGRVNMLVRDYRAAYGDNPVGNNREIVRTLLGDNPRGTRFLDAGTVTLNARGELLDAWGHPYFFHALSGTAMEIRSAGPDGKPYTDDDLVR